MGQVIMIASGKGGVGKSSLAAALSVSLATRGHRVLLIDADLGLRNLDLMLSLQDKVLFELSDCLQRRCSLDEALVSHPRLATLSLIVGGQDAKPKDFSGKDLSRIMRTLKDRFDYLLIDCPAGIGRGIRNFIGLADKYLLVATPDEVCLRDTEKLGRIILDETGEHPWLLLNRYDWRLMRRGLISKPDDIALALDMPLLGVIGHSGRIYAAQLQGLTLAELEEPVTVDALDRAALRLLGLQAEAFVEEKPPSWRDRLRAAFARRITAYDDV